MGMTIAEKILAKHCHKKKVVPGEIVQADLDLVMLTEQLGRRIYREWDKLTDVINNVWDKNKIVNILDHWAPAPHIDAAEIHMTCRKFVKKYGIIGLDIRSGICHQVIAERFARPGMLIVGSDSHTCTYGALNAFSTGLGATDIVVVMATGKNWFKVPETMKINLNGKKPPYIFGKDIILHIIGEISVEGASYKSMEIKGNSLKDISMDSRLTISNMVVEADAKCGIFEADEITQNYFKKKTNEKLHYVKPDSDAKYLEELNFQVDKIEPQVAKPHSPGNAVPVGDVVGTTIQQGFIGSCTNGRFEDLQIAAKILKGKEIHPDARLIITPASREVYLAAMQEGLLEIFIKCGAMVTNPTCGACIGGHLGILASNEVCISTSNRNFKGRMGHPTSKIYLANAATVAASVIKGHITDPRPLMEGK